MCLVDLQGRLLKANAKMCAIFGYSQTALETMVVNDSTLPEDVAVSPRFIKGAVHGDADSAAFEKRYRHQQGHVIHGLVSSKLVRDAQGQPLYFISQVQDITERKQADVALQQAKAALEEAQRLAQVGSWEWTIASDTITWSAELYRIFGRDPSQPPPVYQEYLQIYTAESAARLDAAVKQAIGRGISYEVDLEFFRPDDARRWLINRGEPQGSHGQIVGLRGACIDITDRRQMEGALRLSLAEVQRHDAQMVALNRMNDLLLSCETREEAYGIIANSAKTLLAPYAGGLAVGNGSASDARVVVAWGDPGSLSPFFSLRDCWALRRGKLHEVGPSRDEMDCQHFPDRPPPNYVCAPLNVRGATLGLLHVSASEALTEAQFQELRTLTITVSESIKLALSNLKLQETLRDRR